MNFIRAQQDYDNPNSLASRFRRARARHIVALIQTVFAERGACRIIDLGGRPDYWRIVDRGLLEACKVRITTVNLEDQPPCDDPLFDQTTGDACALEFADNAFDIAHSNSVIEHVGDWGQMERFAAETRRLAPRYYVQTPYFWFPIEPHFSAPFFHWAPEAVRAQRLMKRDHGFMSRADDLGAAMRAVQHARLLDKAMMRYLFPDARHEDETVLGLTKSLMAIRA
ncbi:MAG: class I SAM-dependent methyltransferase [Caulobacteraceae bacterium]|nr:class I SAM-dependent methyltransferase [Caulobacteraceae bacterium]